MKSPLFVRPNLKLFLLGAVLLAVVQDFIAKGHSQGSLWGTPMVVNARGAQVGDLQQLLKQAQQNPSSEAFLRISHCFEQARDYKNAFRYLRKAEILAQLEDVSE